MNFIFVMLMLLLHNGTQVPVPSEVLSIPDGIDSELVCNHAALELVQKAMKLSDTAPIEEKIVKFDYLCLPTPDWTQEPPADQYLNDLKTTVAKTET